MTEKFWQEWFDGLNADFLGFGKPKVLLLAAADRMDKELTIAQMQGKFKLVVLPPNLKVGHCLHEDEPKATAECFVGFLKSFKVPIGMEQIEEMEHIGYGKFSNHL